MTDPEPLEKTDPVLALHLYQIAQGTHEAATSFQLATKSITIFTRSMGVLRKRRRQPGRNDPCPCGSGTKAKRCCWG